MNKPGAHSWRGRNSALSAPNDLSALDEIVDWTAAFLAQRADAEAMAGRMNLVMEELVVNIIDHGYPEGATGTIDLALSEDDDGVTVVIEDHARPFDPLSDAQDGDTEAALEDRAIGGLGVHLVRELTDRISYERVADRNRVTAYFAGEAAAAPVSDNQAPEPAGERRLTFRFILVFLAIFLIGLGCAGVLNYLKFERAFVEAAQSRYDSVVAETRRTIETSLGPGLTLASSFATTTILEKVAAQHSDSFNLTVYDAEGEALYALETPPAFKAYPHDQLYPRLEPDAVLRFGDRDDFGVAMMILQEGEPAGVVVLTRDGKAIARDADRLGSVLLKAGLLIAAIATPILAGAAFLAIWPLENRHLRITGAINALSGQRRSALRPEDDTYGLLDGATRIDAALRRGGASPS